MRRVKLVFVKAFREVPTFKDTTAYDCEFEIPGDFDGDLISLMGARIYDTRVGAAGGPGGDINAVILDSHDFSSILGKLLTYVDATYIDVEQRKAHKDLIKQTLWDWERDLRERAVQAVDSHTSREYVDGGKAASSNRQ